jgi:acetoin utilization deacetylase AcuC-like enzyme
MPLCLAGKVTQVGSGEGEGFTVNLPVPGDAGDACVKLLFEEVISPAVRRFQPDLVVVSAGEGRGHGVKGTSSESSGGE